MEVAYTATYERIGRYMKKRILYMGMAVMLAASMPMATFADETVTGGHCGYNRNKYNHSNI